MSSFITGAVWNVSASPAIDKRSLWPSLRAQTDSLSAHEPNLVATRIYQTRRSYLQVTQSLSKPSIHPSLLPRSSPPPLLSFSRTLQTNQAWEEPDFAYRWYRPSTPPPSTLHPTDTPPSPTPLPLNHRRYCLSHDKRWRRKMSALLTYETLH